MNVQQLENEPWDAADQLRANSRLTAAEYSMPVLGLIFLRHADNRFKTYLPEIAADIPSQVPAAQREELIKLGFQGKIDRAIYNKDTNRKILQNLMDHGVRQADGQTLGKTIVFARNHRHAKLPEQLFDEMFPQYAGKFCQVIDHYDPRAETLIDDFKGEGSNDQLTIAISVDMLDTGIDVPEVVNLVFARPVKSPIKFWQMLGRGTRLCKGLFGPGKDKTHFQVFDHWGVVEYHGLKPRDVIVTQSKSTMQALFEARLNLAQAALQAAEIDFFDTLAQWLHKAVNSLDDKALAVRDKWKVKRQMGELPIIRQFAPNSVVLLETEIAPLMQWVDLRGHADAYQWDLLITRIQHEKLKGSGRFDDLVGEAIGRLHQLQMNLNQVKARAAEIQHWPRWQAAVRRHLHRRPAQSGTVAAHQDPDVPWLRLRQHHAAHRRHESLHARRRRPRHPLSDGGNRGE